MKLPPFVLIAIALALFFSTWIDRLAARQHFRIFLSSPGDVTYEREIARELIKDVLPYTPFIRGRAAFDVISWDDPNAAPGLSARLTPQEAINRKLLKPSECDIVIVMLWSRMGAPLSPEIAKPDITTYQSSTEWEFEDALRGKRENGKPVILLYRRTEEPKIGLGAADFQDRRAQFEAVNAFFEKFRDEDGALTTGVSDYGTPEDFKRLLAQHLDQVAFDALGQGFSEELGASRPAFERFLAILDEQDVPPEQFEAKLEEIAERHRELSERLHALSRSNDEPEITRRREQAAEAIEQGRYDEAATLLEEAAAIDREAIEEQQEALDRRRLSAAATLGQQAELERTRLNYRKAAEHFAEAARLVPSDDNDTRLDYLMQQASVLTDHGREFGDNPALIEAIDLYQQILKERPRERVPLDWARIQNNLGNVLWALGERESGTERLGQAVDAYHLALEESPRERMPLDWARIQNNLGNALRALGERESGTERLEQAVGAYHLALEEHKRERVPLDWAMTQNNLGNAFQDLGSRESGTERLEQAVDAFRAALEEHTRERVPLDWAMTQNNLGLALRDLGLRKNDGTERLEQAVDAFRAALKEHTRERVPLEWARTQNNLGNAFQDLGSRESGTERLEQAVEAYHLALEEHTRERVPLDWATTQNNLGNVLTHLGSRESSTKTLEQAVEAYRAGLDVFEEGRARFYADATRRNLVAAETLLDDTSRKLLTDRAVQDKDQDARGAALRALAETWPDKATRELLVDRVVQDEGKIARGAALQALAAAWSDETTRELLSDRAVRDEDQDVRGKALSVLAETWPDEATRMLLTDLAIQDKNQNARGAVLRALAGTWPDEATRKLLADLAIQDKDQNARGSAFRALAKTWPDEATWKLLRDALVQDESKDVRNIVVGALATGWPNTKTRNLLEACASTDTDASVRVASLGSLVDTWPDDDTIALCHELSLNHEMADTRLAAARALASLSWEETEVREFVRKVAKNDESTEVRTQLRDHVRTLKPRLAGLWESYFHGGKSHKQIRNALLGFPALRVSKFRLRNICVFTDTGEVNVTSPATLLLGNNAAGKTTILKCLALAAVGSEAANEVEDAAASYRRKGSVDPGTIEVIFDLIPEPGAFVEEFGELAVGLQIDSNSDRFIPLPEMTIGECNSARIVPNGILKLNDLRNQSDLGFGLVCAYGATRSFTESRFAIQPEHSKDENEWVVSLFHPNAWLINPDVLSKLMRGDTRNIKNAPDSLDCDIQSALRAGLSHFFPNVEELYSSGDNDLRLNKIDLKFSDLSEGYRSLMAIVGHLVGCSLKLGNWKDDPTLVYGTVLIDEVDLHLHPAWQRHVMRDLSHAFPNIQWITTSHSPMVAASIDSKSIIALRSNGSESRLVSELPSIWGWPVDQILTSELFNLQTTQDIETENLVGEYAALLNDLGPDDEDVRILEQELVLREGGTRSNVRVDEEVWELVMDATKNKLKQLTEEERLRMIAQLRISLHL